MNNITYGIINEKYCLGNECRQAFGIAVYADADADGTATIIQSVHDISPNEIALKELVNRCNHLGLSPIHLLDIIEDFLSA